MKEEVACQREEADLRSGSLIQEDRGYSKWENGAGSKERSLSD